MSLKTSLAAAFGLALAAIVAVPAAVAAPTAAQQATAMGNNAVNAVNAIAPGWAWTDRKGFASLLGGKTQNEFFTVVNGALRIKPGKKPSDALKHIFFSKGEYGVECASAAVLILQAARLQTLGAKDFDKLYPNNGFRVAGWADNRSVSTFSTTFKTRRYTRDRQAKIAGKWNKKGENMPFDPSKGDKLVIGGVYYFEILDDTTSGNQGWNVVYMGRNAQGKYGFFRSPTGVSWVDLDTRNNYVDKTGAFPNGFLSANITLPDGARLVREETDGSTAW